MGLGSAAGEVDGPAEKMADELVFWVRDNLPSWKDNDPYYDLWFKARDMFKDALESK